MDRNTVKDYLFYKDMYKAAFFNVYPEGFAANLYRHHINTFPELTGEECMTIAYKNLTMQFNLALKRLRAAKDPDDREDIMWIASKIDTIRSSFASSMMVHGINVRKEEELTYR